MAEGWPSWRGIRPRFVFTAVLCAWLIMVAVSWAMALAEDWGSTDRADLVVCACLLYAVTLALLLLGVCLPERREPEATLRRALVLVPVGVVGCALAMVVLLALEELGGPTWWTLLAETLNLSWGPAAFCTACGALSGLGLIVATGRVPMGRLLDRTWLILFVAAAAASFVTFCVFIVCSERREFLWALEAFLGMFTAGAVLSWSVAFGLAVAATRGRNAAPAGPPGGPDAQAPPRAQR